MPESFGARLRETRERQHVALSTIGEQTKIKVSLLEALERDDVSHWPSGIFRRAFVRAYAHAIGLEPDVVVREFLECYPDPPEIFAHAMPGNGVEDGRATDAAPIRLKYLVASAIGSVSRLRVRPNHKPESLLDLATTVPNPVSVAEAPSVQPRLAIDEDVMAPRLTPAALAEPHPEPTVPVQSEPEVAAAPEAAVAAAAPEVVASGDVASLPVDSDEPDLMAVAHLCSELARVQTTTDVPPLLGEMSKILDAIGVILWIWDPIASELRPAFTHGYSDRVVAQLPRVDNGALAVPLMGPSSCAGVLAIELPERREDKESIRAYATILAAQLATLIGTAAPAEASDRRLA
jgi:transcriptional regulator with XRE-family HTH domain